MSNDSGPIVRLDPCRTGPSATAARPSSSLDDEIAEVRSLALDGRLVDALASAGAARRIVLRRAVHAVAWPVVFSRITRTVELRRGHPACARGLAGLAPECVDRFHDDVEAVVDVVCARATGEIENLEGWIASRVTAATVDGHRRRRGRRGALQRPRTPKWLAEGLRQDPWLIALALDVLDWVGVPTTAGAELWPLDGWARHRAEVTGDWAGSDPPTVAREVEVVLSVMRGHADWYADHVERPLGGKQPHVAASPSAEQDHGRPLVLLEPDEEAHLSLLATEAVSAMEERLARGEDPTAVVTEVLSVVFGEDLGSVERLPHDESCEDEWVATLLRDPDQVSRVVAEVLDVIRPV